MYAKHGKRSVGSGERLPGVPSLTKSKPEDLKEFCEELGLFLKPIARITVSVSLPAMRTPNQSISTWEVMEKLKKKARPHHFKTLRVLKSSLDMIRFEGEFESTTVMDFVLPRLDKVSLKLAGFAENLKVSAGHVKVSSSALLVLTILYSC